MVLQRVGCDWSDLSTHAYFKRHRKDRHTRKTGREDGIRVWSDVVTRQESGGSRWCWKRQDGFSPGAAVGNTALRCFGLPASRTVSECVSVIIILSHWVCGDLLVHLQKMNASRLVLRLPWSLPILRAISAHLSLTPACRGSYGLRDHRNSAQGQTKPRVACRPHTCHPSFGTFSTKLSGSPHNLSLGSSHAKRKQVLNKYLLIDHLVDIFMSLTIII